MVNFGHPRKKKFFFVGMLESYKFGVGPLSCVRIYCRCRRKPGTSFFLFFPGFSGRNDLRSRCWRHTLSWTCPGYFFELVSFLALKTFKNNVFIEYRSSITFHMPNRGPNLYCFGMNMNLIFIISQGHDIVLGNFPGLFHFPCLRSSKIMFSMISLCHGLNQ